MDNNNIERMVYNEEILYIMKKKIKKMNQELNDLINSLKWKKNIIQQKIKK